MSELTQAACFRIRLSLMGAAPNHDWLEAQRDPELTDSLLGWLQEKGRLPKGEPVYMFGDGSVLWGSPEGGQIKWRAIESVALIMGASEKADPERVGRIL